VSLSVAGVKHLKSHIVSPSAEDEEKKKTKRLLKAEQEDVPADQSSLKRTIPLLSASSDVKSAKLDLDRVASALEEHLEEAEEDVTQPSVIVESGTKLPLIEPDITSSTCVGIVGHVKDTVLNTGKKPVLCKNDYHSFRIFLWRLFKSTTSQRCSRLQH